MSSDDWIIGVRDLGKDFYRYRHEAMRLGDMLFNRTRGDAIMALDDVTFEVRRGEAVGIIGRNGSGKSTLLKLVSGTMAPTRGHVSLRGRIAALLELGAGFHPDYTGRENARFAVSTMGFSAPELEQKIHEIEDFAEIGEFIDRNVSEYSTGMFARLAFSVSIHSLPDILIVDEILAVGDISFQYKSMQFLRRFRDRGGTLLFVSHDEVAVRGLCDRALWLEHGRVQAEGRADRVCSLYHAAISRQGAAAGFSVVDADPNTASGPKPESDSDNNSASASDPDALSDALGGGRIAALRLFDAECQPVATLRGGEEVELRVECMAETALEQPVVTILLRNRLAQIIFAARSDDLGEAVPRLAAQESATARFIFTLPHVPSGEYVIEALLGARVGDAEVLIDRLAPLTVPVSTFHISSGLANIRMAEVRVEILDEAAS